MSVKAVFSPLTKFSVATNKYSSRNGKKVTRLVIHHTAGGSDTSNVTLLSTGARKVSSTYVLQQDGDLVGIVPEQFRPWTSGSFTADGPSVTVETVTNKSPEWPVTSAQVEKLAQLAADLSTRYGWGKLTRKNVKGHREFASTSCPGPSLWPKLEEIIKRGNEILEGKAEAPKPAPLPRPIPKPTPPPPTTTKPVRSIASMASEVIAGKHGNGHAKRQKSLGVSTAVYNKVRAEVNRRVYGASKTYGTPKTVAQMASEVIAGKHGNGHARRRKSLGVSQAVYERVRAEVNRRV